MSILTSQSIKLELDAPLPIPGAGGAKHSMQQTLAAICGGGGAVDAGGDDAPSAQQQHHHHHQPAPLLQWRALLGDVAQQQVPAPIVEFELRESPGPAAAGLAAPLLSPTPAAAEADSVAAVAASAAEGTAGGDQDEEQEGDDDEKSDRALSTEPSGQPQQQLPAPWQVEPEAAEVVAGSALRRVSAAQQASLASAAVVAAVADEMPLRLGEPETAESPELTTQQAEPHGSAVGGGSSGATAAGLQGMQQQQQPQALRWQGQRDAVDSVDGDGCARRAQDSYLGQSACGGGSGGGELSELAGTMQLQIDRLVSAVASLREVRRLMECIVFAIVLLVC
jgi:hypothetical protein